MADTQTIVKTVKIVTDASGAKAGGQEAQSAFAALERSIDSASEHLASLHEALATAGEKLAEFAALVGVGFGVEKIYEFTEAWEKATYQIEAVVGSSAGAAFAMDKLFDASQRSRTSIDGNVETFSRLMIVQDQLGASQAQLAQFTEAVSTAMALMGKGSDQTAGLVGNFTRALASGTVGTREFRSILAETPMLAEEMAQHIDGANGSIQRLRDMMAQGQVSSRQFFDAITASLPELQSRLSEIPSTVGQAVTQLENSFKKLMGSIDESTGATKLLAEGIQFLADHLTDAARILGVFAAGALIVAGSAGLGAIPAALSAVVTGLGYLTAAMMANPFIAAVTAITMAAAALYDFRNHTVEVAGVQTTLGATIQAVWSVTVNWIENAIDKITFFAKASFDALTFNITDLTKLLDSNSTSVKRNTDFGVELNAVMIRNRLEAGLSTDQLGQLTAAWNAHGDAANSSTDATKKQVDAFTKLRDSVDPVLKALDDQAKRLEELDAARNLNLVSGAEYLRLQQLIQEQATLDLQAANEKVNVVQTAVDKINMETQATAYELGGRKDLADALRTEYDLRLKLVNISPDQVKAITDATAALEREKQALKDHQKEQDATAQAAKKAQQEIAKVSQDASDQIVNAFMNMAEGAKNPFDSLKAYALKIFNEIAAAAIIRPIIQPIIADAVGAAAGLVSGGGSSGSSLANAASLASSGYTLGGGSTGFFGTLGSGAANWINQMGTQYLGTGVTLGSATPADWAAGNIGGTPLTSYLGDAGIGAMAGNLITGLIGGNKTVGTIGGAISGALFAVNPVAGAVAAVATLIGSLFGGKPSDKTAGYAGDLLTDNFRAIGNTPGMPKYDQQNDQQAQQIVSGLSQFAQQIVQVTGATLSQQASALEVYVGSRDGLRARFAETGGWSQDPNANWQSFANAGDMTQAVIKNIIDGLQGLSPDIQTALQHIDWTGDINKNMSLVSFAKGFQDMLTALKGGATDITKTVEGAASAQVAQTVQQIQTFLSTTQQLGLDVGAATEASKEYVEQLVGIKQAAPAIGAAQTAFESLDGTLEALKPLLDAVGISFDDAAAAVQAAKNKIAASFDSNLDEQIAEIKTPVIKTIAGFFKDYSNNLSDATFLGDGDKLKTLLQDEIANALQGLTTDQLQGVITYYSTISGGQVAVDAATAALNALTAAASGTASAAAAAASAVVADANTDISVINSYLQSQQQAISSLTQQASAWQSVSTSLANAAQGIVTNTSLSALSPGDRLVAAQAAYEQVKAAAQSGDIGAAGQLGQSSQDYLTAAKAYFGGGADYYARFQDVQATLRNTETVADMQASIAQQQANLLQQQVSDAQAQVDALNQLVNGSKLQVTTMGQVLTLLQTISTNLAAAGIAPPLPTVTVPPNIEKSTSTSASNSAQTDDQRAGFAMMQNQLNSLIDLTTQQAKDISALRAAMARQAAT